MFQDETVLEYFHVTQ